MSLPLTAENLGGPRCQGIVSKFKECHSVSLESMFWHWVCMEKSRRTENIFFPAQQRFYLIESRRIPGRSEGQ